jgi:hypothetical protein
VQVKQTVERCLAEGMNKAQIFRELREEELQLGAAFAGESIIQSSNFVRISFSVQWIVASI